MFSPQCLSVHHKDPTSCLDTYCTEHYIYVLMRSLTHIQPHTHSLADLQLGTLPETKCKCQHLKAIKLSLVAATLASVGPPASAFSCCSIWTWCNGATVFQRLAAARVAKISRASSLCHCKLLPADAAFDLFKLQQGSRKQGSRKAWALQCGLYCLSFCMSPQLTNMY